MLSHGDRSVGAGCLPSLPVGAPASASTPSPGGHAEARCPTEPAHRARLDLVDRSDPRRSDVDSLERR